MWRRNDPQRAAVVTTSEHRYMPLQDDISSVAYWYSDNLEDEYPALPDANYMEII